jgi:hypothetical protein
MNYIKYLTATTCIALVIVCLHVSASGQSNENRLVSISSAGQGVRFDVAAPNAGLTITISAPDGQVFSKEFQGAVADFRLANSKGERFADGQYYYEVRVTPQISSDVKETLAAARAKGNSDEVRRDLIKRGALPAQPLVVSGGFAILNGSVVVPGALEEGGSASATNQPRVFKRAAGTAASSFRPNSGASVIGLRRHHPVVNPFFDFVIADDLIVQGSGCFGLDCVDGENFGFDTIRVKENNTRIQFDDTSVSAGFATNNWQIRANAQGSGGGAFLAFVDQGATGNSETGTIVFEVDAGAPANSLRVSSGGNIGIGTATPVLDVHANTTDTPAIRLEQNNSGGFTAQTWDIGANEANFFVRDVTSGSRLPFRVRPGAPTSSVDIAASGNVGIGTGSPTTARLVIDGTSGATGLDLSSDDLYADMRVIRNTLNTTDKDLYLQFLAGAGSKLHLFSNNSETMTLTGGQVGIGTTSPTATLSVSGTANKTGGGSWDVFSDERLKLIRGNYNRGLNAVMQLQPLRYQYKPDNALGLTSKNEYIGFGAQAVQKVIPEAVTTNSGYLQINNDPIIWTMLNAIKEQQKQIEELKAEVRRLRTTSRRRR